MTRVILAISGSARPFVSLGHALETLWHHLTGHRSGAYHPERHYMRGPGPACRAKTDQARSA
jgi:hypothetical protein